MHASHGTVAANVRRAAPWVVAAVLGVGVGEFLLRGPFRPAPTRLLFVASPSARGAHPVLLTGLRRGPGASDGAITTLAGAAGPEQPGPHDSDPPVPVAQDNWMPRAVGDGQRRGGAGDPVLQGAAWYLEADVRSLPANAEEAALLESFHKDYLDGLRQDANVRAGLVPPPWRDAPFKVAGTIGRTTGPNFLVLGRDFLPDAGPEATLAWYEQSYAEVLPSPQREAALEVLRRYEASKHASFLELAEAVSAHMQAEGVPVAADAFMITADGVRLFRQADDTELQAVFEALRRADEEVVATIRDVLR